ncbi:MAG: hypothetical protein UW69_C0083G0008 [Microgenomates group bacterium GW2011_GWA2_44_7]|nr:MAG: hypothetical protein UW69_C0083G0008 [Microgenomates group bacterium GW2011_GWA2_44_7]
MGILGGRSPERNHQDSGEPIREGRDAGSQLTSAAAETQRMAHDRHKSHYWVLQRLVDLLIRKGHLEKGSVVDANGSVRTPGGERIDLNEIAQGNLRD